MTEQEKNAAFAAANTILIQDVLELIHRLDPEAVEAKLRAARLFVQETEAGRIDDQDEQLTTAHRVRRDVLERAVARGRELDD